MTACLGASVAPAEPSESIDFREGWRFTKGDPAAAEQIEFDDSSWSAVPVPHDWAISGPFNPEENGSTGKLPWRGVGWYRKSFTIDREVADRVYLDFDGVMAFPKVYINGQLAGEWDYGYTSFRIDATPYINLHGENTVAVRVDTTRHNSRWYPGAGIYRKVMLQLRKPVHIAHWGVHVVTPKVEEEAAVARVKATVDNHQDQPARVMMRFELHPPGAGPVVRFHTSEKVAILQPGPNTVEASFEIASPKLWDVDQPNLYTLTTSVLQEDAIIDQQLTSIGFRKVELTANDGLHLNGRRVQLNGVNLHHDHGPLGAAFCVRAMERQLEIMRDMGVNAIRTSHNPPAPELLDLCDRMGLLVWDEAFDKWNDTADRVDEQPSHEEHAERHLRSLVMRDRNHPSVVVWSVGNEIKEGGDGVTAERLKMMRQVIRKYDGTRPVGIGCHIPEQAHGPLLRDLDFTGWNYMRRYAEFRKHHPDKPIVYSESASALSTRGFYELPLPKTKTEYSTRGQVNSYDFNAAAWSDIADAEFALMERDRFVAGEFVWTGFDYLGEPTPFEQQAKSSYFGAVDLCGISKDRYYLYRSYWRPDEPTVHLLPHWNWPERVGHTVPVFVYTNGDEAELFLNGKSLGRRAKGDRPAGPTNFATQSQSTASSFQEDKPPAAAVDDDQRTQWSAATGSSNDWLQLDLKQDRPLRCIVLEFDREAKNYGYVIEASANGEQWEPILRQEPSDQPEWGGPHGAVHDVKASGRYVRIQFKELRDRAQASIREFRVFPAEAASSYYDPTYDYRLRWNDVVYEPGVLEAVAYKEGRRVGVATVRTAGPPAALRLTPDRTELNTSGDDLSYVLVEAIDAEGNPCPLANNQVTFTLEGNAEIAGVGNGDPLSLEPFQANRVSLFYGKAMLIVRANRGEAGPIQVNAAAGQLTGADASLTSTTP